MIGRHCRASVLQNNTKPEWVDCVVYCLSVQNGLKWVNMARASAHAITPSATYHSFIGAAPLDPSNRFAVLNTGAIVKLAEKFPLTL